MALSGERNWCWGSLRPWQILHSRLAEKGARGEALDVCELIDETLGAADLRNGDWEEERYHDEAYFLDDDGEFWRLGGVMEARIREWLARREAQEEEEGNEGSEQEEQQPEKNNVVTTLSKCCAGRSAVATRAWSPYPQEEEDAQQQEANGCYEDEGEADPVMAAAAKYVASPPNIAAASQLSDEEFEVPDVCAVCLEKVLPNEPLYLLPCRHKFHSECLSPWLLERPHACCPCCRAAVPDDVSPQLPSAEAIAEMAVFAYQDAPHGEGDIMCLLAEMEAALERFGLRS